MIEALPWARASAHAGFACHGSIESRVTHLALLLLYTSLPVLIVYFFCMQGALPALLGFSALALLTGADLYSEELTQLFCITFMGVPEYLAQQGFRRVIEVRADGGCFFDAAARALQTDETRVRDEIAGWIEGDRFDHLPQDHFARGLIGADQRELHARRIREADLELWGDQLEAVAVAEIFNVCVTTYTATQLSANYGAGQGVDLFFTTTQGHLGEAQNHYKLLKRTIF